MVRMHHQLNGHETEQMGDSEGQRSLECYTTGGHKEQDMTQPLNNNNDTYTLRTIPVTSSYFSYCKHTGIEIMMKKNSINIFV